MKFMIIRKADRETEAGSLPSDELLAAMAAYNERLVDAGVFRDGTGLKPSVEGARIRFEKGNPIVTDGPFTETRELIAEAGARNLGLVLDTWHWLRQPGGPDEATLRSIPGSRIHCVQLDDTTLLGSGDDPMMESMTARLLPGEGDVDWTSLLGILDDIGADPIWAPEVFSVELLHEGPLAMARRIRDSTRKVLCV